MREGDTAQSTKHKKQMIKARPFPGGCFQSHNPSIKFKICCAAYKLAQTRASSRIIPETATTGPGYFE